MKFVKWFFVVCCVFSFVFSFSVVYAEGEFRDYALSKGIDQDKINDLNSAISAYNIAKSLVSTTSNDLNNGLAAEMGRIVVGFAYAKISAIESESSSAVAQSNTADTQKAKVAIDLVKVKSTEAIAFLPTVKKYFDETKVYANKILNASDPNIKLRAPVIIEEASSSYDMAKKAEANCKSNITKAEELHKQAIENAAKLTSPSTAYGSGNITCGNRTFSCTRGGWFANVSNECYCCGQCTPDDLITVGNTILKWLFGIIGAVGLAIFVWGGFNWVTSAGDTGKVAAGRKTMTSAAIGLMIMFSAGAVVKLVQEGLGIDSSSRISITNEGPSYKESTQASDPSKSEVHGTLKIGEACLYNQSTMSSHCSEGLYCYSLDQTKGVCLPLNPEKTVDPGGVCYVLPGDGTKDMCKSGTCQTTDKTVGAKGVCPTLEDNINLGVGDSCKTNADCAGSANLFTGVATCYKKSGSTTGKCIPSTGRDVPVGGSCYVLPGTNTNDCAFGLLCVQNPDASDPKLNRTVGELGVCYHYKNRTTGYSCSKGFECEAADSCKQVPKADFRSYCVKIGTEFNVQENGFCEQGISVYDPNYTVDNCWIDLTCAEIEGVNKCVAF